MRLTALDPSEGSFPAVEAADLVMHRVCCAFVSFDAVTASRFSFVEATDVPKPLSDRCAWPREERILGRKVRLSSSFVILGSTMGPSRKPRGMGRLVSRRVLGFDLGDRESSWVLARASSMSLRVKATRRRLASTTSSRWD